MGASAPIWVLKQTKEARMIKPHSSYRYMRADEVAECWPCSKELYIALWNKVVPHQKEIPNLEDTGPADHIGFENLAAHWSKLTQEEQAELNKLAKAQDEEYEAWRRSI